MVPVDTTKKMLFRLSPLRTSVCQYSTGTEHLKFSSMQEFKKWKEYEEERTYSAYVQQQSPYCPKLNSGIRYI